MLDKTQILKHAKSAVDQAAHSLSGMRTRLKASGLSRQHRLIADEAMHDLSRRYEVLVNLYEEMLGIQDTELPTYWQRFFACYDDYLEAVRDAKSRLVREVE